MEYLIGYVIGLLIYGVIFGFITAHVSESKGYDGGFWWGFWLGIIGLLVVGFRPDNRPQQPSVTPSWASSSSSNSSYGNEKGWTCVCGGKNPSSIDYCLSCRRSKTDCIAEKKICPHCGAGNKPTNTICFACDKPLEEKEEKAQATEQVDYAAMLEQLAKLHDQHVLTDEEFQQKKAEILAKM